MHHMKTSCSNKEAPNLHLFFPCSGFLKFKYWLDPPPLFFAPKKHYTHISKYKQFLSYRNNCNLSTTHYFPNHLSYMKKAKETTEDHSQHAANTYQGNIKKASMVLKSPLLPLYIFLKAASWFLQPNFKEAFLC